MDVTVKNKVLQETGMVMDFGELKRAVEEEVIEKLDHGFINEYIDFPSCEMMIPWIWFRLSKRVKGLYSIKVWETDGSYCELTAPLLKDYLAHFECDWTKDSNEIEEDNAQKDEVDNEDHIHASLKESTRNIAECRKDD